MNSSRYWNTIRSNDDFDRTRDLWDLGTMRIVDHVPGQYHYALGDATNAYSREKLRTFTRELVYVPGSNLLFVFDRVVSNNPAFRKAWLLHGVNRPIVDGESGESAGVQEFSQAKSVRFSEGSGEVLVHTLLPEKRVLTRRGGNANEFFTPGDYSSGAWGTGENWPLEAADGSPLPEDPKLRRMWKLFWGEDFDRILSSNRKNVVPGAWRIEVSPTVPSEEDHFLHVLEIGDTGKTGRSRVELLNGSNLKGAAFEHGPIVLFNCTAKPISDGEASLPNFGTNALIITGLHPEALYEINLNGLNVSSPPDSVLPGVSAGIQRLRSNGKGVLRIERNDLQNLRLRLLRI